MSRAREHEPRPTSIGRKSSKTIRGEAVWPPHLEAAFFEGSSASFCPGADVQLLTASPTSQVLRHTNLRNPGKPYTSVVSPFAIDGFQTSSSTRLASAGTTSRSEADFSNLRTLLKAESVCYFCIRLTLITSDAHKTTSLAESHQQLRTRCAPRIEIPHSNARRLLR